MAFYLMQMGPAPAALWIGDPDPNGTPEPYLYGDQNVFLLRTNKPVVLVVVDEEPDPEAALTAYAVRIKGPTSFSIVDWDESMPEPPPSGGWLQEDGPHYYTISCKRPFQLNISQEEVIPEPVPAPLPVPEPVPVPVPVPPPVLSDLTTVVWDVWFSSPPSLIRWSDGYPLPTAKPGLHYVAFPVGNLVGVKAMRLRFEITGNGNVLNVDPGDVETGQPPRCKITPFFGLPDTTWSPLRFWNGGFTIPFTPGIHEVTVPMDPNAWTSVNGQPDSAAFAAMVSRSCFVGWTCGGTYFAGHGVYSPDGSVGIYVREYVLLG